MVYFEVNANKLGPTKKWMLLVDWWLFTILLYDEYVCLVSGTKTRVKAINKIPRTIAQVTNIMSWEGSSASCSKSMTMQIKELLVRKALISCHNLLFHHNNRQLFLFQNPGKSDFARKWALHVILRDGEESDEISRMSFGCKPLISHEQVTLIKFQHDDQNKNK